MSYRASEIGSGPGGPVTVSFSISYSRARGLDSQHSCNDIFKTTSRASQSVD